MPLLQQINRDLSEREEQIRLEKEWSNWHAPHATSESVDYAVSLLSSDNPKSEVAPHLRKLYKTADFDEKGTGLDNIGKFKHTPLHQAIAQ